MLKRPLGVCPLAGRTAVATAMTAPSVSGLVSSTSGNGGSHSPSMLTPVAMASEQRRFLRFAKSEFGFKIRRWGTRKFPMWRFPTAMSTRHLNYLMPERHWQYNLAKSPERLLPKENYVINHQTGAFYMNKKQIYTLQHTAASTPIRVRRFPTTYTFQRQTRWAIGTKLQSWVLPRAQVVDEVAISKRQRLVYVKLGIIAE